MAGKTELFGDLANLRDLDFIVENSPEDLRNTLQSIPFPIKVVTIYAIGTRHIAWIRTAGQIKKIKKVRGE